MALPPLVFPVAPMLAAPVRDLPVGNAMVGGCWYEPKFDGYRGVVFVEEGRARVQSRAGNDMTRPFADIAEAAHRSLPPGTVIDGELLIWDDGALDFSALQRRLASGRRAASLAARRPASLLVFDLLALAGTDVRHHHLTERRLLLDHAFRDIGPPLQLVPYSTDPDVAREWMATYREARVGIEGLVIKGSASRYEPGRRGWAKLRIRDTVEVIVGAVTGTAQMPVRLVVGYRDTTGRLVIAGSTATLTRGQREEVAALLTPATAEHPWPEVIGPGRLGNWGGQPQRVDRVEPLLVIEVSGDTAVDERGRWRHLTRFVRARPDLGPDDVAPLG